MSSIPDPSLPVAAPDTEPTGVLRVLLDRYLSQRGDLLSVKDAHSGRYLHVNAGLSNALNLVPAQILGRTDADLLEPAQVATMRAAEQTALAHGSSMVTEHRLGSAERACCYSVMRTVIEVDRRPLLCAVWSDLTLQRRQEAQLQAALAQIEQQQQANDRLRHDLADQALRDPDSGLHRRAHLEDQLRRELDLSTREHREFAIVFIELDPPGAEVLALGDAGSQRVYEAMGRLLRSGTRAMDAACRYGERRFAVLLSGVGLATAHARMEGLRRTCAGQIVVHEGAELGFTVSMGVASFPHTARTQHELVDACEAALADARQRGGNHVRLASICFDAGEA